MEEGQGQALQSEGWLSYLESEGSGRSSELSAEDREVGGHRAWGRAMYGVLGSEQKSEDQM